MVGVAITTVTGIGVSLYILLYSTLLLIEYAHSIAQEPEIETSAPLTSPRPRPNPLY